MIKKFLFFLYVCLFSANALKIVVNKGNVTAEPIAVVFFEDGGRESARGNDIGEVITTDFKYCGLLNPINPESFIESTESLAKNGPISKNWTITGARFLLYGKVTGNIRVDFVLFDVVAGQKMLELTVNGSSSQPRRIAHAIADFVYERITGEKGYFNTQIVYTETADAKNSAKRKTRLVQIDQDGFNRKELTDGSELVITPKYSADAKRIAYISYSDKGKGILGKSAHIYITNVDSRRTNSMLNDDTIRKLSKKNHNNPVQMTYALGFSPDGKSAVFAVIIDGKSAIYMINFETNQLTQLTEHKCIDTSPCFSNDGKKIVFTSNRAGREAIYVMNADGSDQRKISSGEGKYSQPVWSPRGDLIAFSKQIGGQFFIGVMKLDGSGERLLTSGYLVEAPCWSSNGRYIAYSMQAGPGAKNSIAVIDITGHHIRSVETKGDASYPTWSPTISVKQ